MFLSDGPELCPNPAATHLHMQLIQRQKPEEKAHIIKCSHIFLTNISLLLILSLSPRLSTDLLSAATQSVLLFTPTSAIKQHIPNMKPQVIYACDSGVWWQFLPKKKSKINFNWILKTQHFTCHEEDPQQRVAIQGQCVLPSMYSCWKKPKSKFHRK